MRRSGPALAKLSRPRLYDPVARDRLFACLDEARQHPVVWISGPPGAGKTTIVASYLETRRVTGEIWYQLDPGDSDPPTFFYHLRLAEQGLSGTSRKAPLPLLTPEYMPDIPGYARRFMRELFTRMRPGSLLILDNFHELGEETSLHEALAAAFAQIPGHINVAVLSRSRPSAPYSHQLGDGTIAEIGWTQLQLTLEETQALISAHRATRHIDALYLHREAGGWAAGLTLLIQRFKRGDSVDARAAIDAPQDIFDYFASGLFNKTQSQERDTLLRLSMLPHFTSTLAVEVSADQTVERLLEYLYRRNLFLDRRLNKQGEYVYQFHTLFRTFLRHQAQISYSVQSLLQLKLKCAQLLESAQQTEDAVDLFIAVEHWPSAVRMIKADAASLLVQGRRQVVLDRINALPKAQVDDEPWLLYWLGVAQMAFSPIDARRVLLNSHIKAREHRDNHCVLQAAAAVVQTYLLEYSDLRPLDEWLPVLEDALSGDPFPSVDAELAVVAALLVVISYRQPAHRGRTRCLERVYELAIAHGDANLHLVAIGYVLAHSCTTGDLSDGSRAIAIARDLLNRPEITAMNKGWWLAIYGWHCTLTGDFASARRTTNEIVRIGADNGLPVVSRFALMGIWTEIFAGHLQLAEHMAEQAPPPTNAIYDVATISGALSLIATLDGRPSASADKGLLAVRLFDEMGSRMHRVNFRIAYAWTQIQLGELERARNLIEEVRSIESDRERYWQQPLLLALEAEIHRRRSDEASRQAAVRASLSLACKGDYWYAFVHPFGVRKMCLYALRHDIEPEYTRHIIRRLRWPAPSQTILGWPWPVRIHTLGEFKIFRDEQVLQFGRKAPHRLLAVLKTLIAFGGRDVSAQRLADTLWPDADGGAAMSSLAVSLRRLRELLGGEVVGEVDGKVGLDEEHVWVDVWAFEGAVENASSDREALIGCLDLYRGAFLAEETDARWAVQTRERIRAKFVEQVALQAASMEAAGNVQGALTLYHRGIEADDVAESFYQGLMRCQLRLGHRGEALRTYRRLRQILSVVLGVAPAEETEALLRLAQ